MYRSKASIQWLMVRRWAFCSILFLSSLQEKLCISIIYYCRQDQVYNNMARVDERKKGRRKLLAVKKMQSTNRGSGEGGGEVFAICVTPELSYDYQQEGESNTYQVYVYLVCIYIYIEK